MTVHAFQSREALTLQDPLINAADSVSVAAVNYAVAIQEATTVERLMTIRTHIAARRLELDALESMAFEKANNA